MARNGLSVRPATVEDLPALLAFGEELRELILPVDGGRTRGVPPAARVLLEQRYREALADPDRHLVIVQGQEAEPLGMALLTVAPANALLDLPAVHMSHAVVPDRHKRRGVGKTLVGAAAAFAEQRGVEQLVVSVHPGSRDANRFFARLGFVPLAVRRVAPVPVIRRRLAQIECGPVDATGPQRPRRRVRLPQVNLGPAETESQPS